MGFAAFASALVLISAQSSRDPFTAQRDAAAALNPGSARFTIAVEGNRRSFRVGERIPLVFTYDNLNRSSHDAADRSYRQFADAVLDRTHGTGQPSKDFERSGLYLSGGVCCGVPAGVVGGATRFGGIGFDANGVPFFLPDVKLPPPPPPPPVRLTFLLNDGVRFDAPGRYRLYMADRHEAKPGRQYGRPAPPPLISNIIALEITARDETWEADTVREAAAVLDGSADPLQRADAARTLQFLGSRAAIDVMARRLLLPMAPTIELEEGLFGARDRDYVIRIMAAYADDASQPVSWWYLRTFAALRLTRSRAGALTSHERHQALLAVHHRRLRALARARVLTDRLKITFEASVAEPAATPPRLPPVPLTRALTSYAREVEAVLMALPPKVRDSVIAKHSAIFASDAGFAPMLGRLAAAGSPIARTVVTDLTAPSDPRPSLDAVDLSDRYVSVRYDPETNRRCYSAAGVWMSFVELGQVFSRFRRGTTLTWYDPREWDWHHDSSSEFRRVEDVARRHGLKLSRP